METSELVRRAEHCIRTGQPNLAMLYMEKAYDQTHKERLEMADFFTALGIFYQDALEVVGAAAKEVQKAFSPIVDAFVNMGEALQEALHIRTTPPDLHQPFGQYPKPFEYTPHIIWPEQ